MKFSRALEQEQNDKDAQTGQGFVERVNKTESQSVRVYQYL